MDHPIWLINFDGAWEHSEIKLTFFFWKNNLVNWSCSNYLAFATRIWFIVLQVYKCNYHSFLSFVSFMSVIIIIAFRGLGKLQQGIRRCWQEIQTYGSEIEKLMHSLQVHFSLSGLEELKFVHIICFIALNDFILHLNIRT